MGRWGAAHRPGRPHWGAAPRPGRRHPGAHRYGPSRRRHGAHNYGGSSYRHSRRDIVTHRPRRVVRIVYRDLRGPHVHVVPHNAMWSVVEFDSRGRWTTTKWRNTRQDARRLADAVNRMIRRTGEPALGTFQGGDR